MKGKVNKMKGYIEFEFKLNGELYELTTEYDNDYFTAQDIKCDTDKETVLELIDNALTGDKNYKCNNDIDLSDLADEIDKEEVEITDLAFGDYDLYEEWSEQVDVDDFVEKKESVILW